MRDITKSPPVNSLVCSVHLILRSDIAISDQNDKMYTEATLYSLEISYPAQWILYRLQDHSVFRMSLSQMNNSYLKISHNPISSLSDLPSWGLRGWRNSWLIELATAIDYVHDRVLSTDCQLFARVFRMHCRVPQLSCEIWARFIGAKIWALPGNPNIAYVANRTSTFPEFGSTLPFQNKLRICNMGSLRTLAIAEILHSAPSFK